MKPKDVLEYFSVNNKSHGAQSRFARAVNITPQYASYILRCDEVPFSIQCELELRTDGELKVDKSLLDSRFTKDPTKHGRKNLVYIGLI